MELHTLLGGMLLGMAFSAPVGPVGILCARRSLLHGTVAGALAGLGAAVADALYAYIAVSATSAVTELLLDHQDLVRLPGALILLAVGVGILRKASAPQPTVPVKEGLVASWISTFALTLANPLVILAFGAAISVYQTDIGSGWRGATIVLGVFVGSACWWWILSALVARLRSRMTNLTTINRIAGWFVVGSGIVVLVGVLA